MNQKDFVKAVRLKIKNLHKGEARTIDCPNCGAFIQVYRRHNGKLCCRCNECHMTMF